LPAWGATVRIPRLTDMDGTLRILLRGETLDPAAARGLGIIDRIIPAADFRARVARYALRRARRDRGIALSDRPLNRGILDGSRGARRLMLNRAARRYLSGPDSAPAGSATRVTFDLLARSDSLSAERAFALEASLAARVMTSAEARGRLHAERCLARVSGDLPESGPVIRSAAVLGSNRTASDLAALLVAAGVTVRMKDERRDLVARGVAIARERIEWERSNRRISAAEAGRRLTRLLPVTGYGGFGTLDLVISAHRSVAAARTDLRDCHRHVGPGCLLALHTWGATANPSDFEDIESPAAIGLALSLPADRFPLLEIIAGPGADPTSIAAIRRLADRLGLTTVRVPAGSPSPGTRLIATYFAEASRLIDEGATVVQVDDAAERFGFEVGPFRRMDAMGADRAYEIVAAIATPFTDSLSARWFGRFARESRTFYTYRSGVPGEPNPLLPPGLSPDGDTVEDMVQRRLSLALTGEAIRILETGRVNDAALLEVIVLRALGYPARRGGLLFQARQVGFDTLLTEFEAAESRFGKRFAPPGLLKEWASADGGAGGAAKAPDLDRMVGWR
ncbi:MAG TPA: 3-hydroxyacyl-CoA dehydrogenase family protein, partial [Longimicrobiaceae bacterium]|nr:3-hydroxyacyl-CoA dehydrogenase family protein [Longimicrobiaceae bacterium]